MERTINQIKFEFKEIATKHEQINDFFFGQFIDAISDSAINYPLMVVTLLPGDIGKIQGMRKRSNLVKLAVTICDKYNADNHRQIDEVHSDTFTICADICSVLEAPRFEDYINRSAASSISPFIEKGSDIVAGQVVQIDLDVFDDGNFCSIPFDGYDFENSQFKTCNA